jgi:hypothetical protein
MRVIDVGCGAGTTSLAAARAVGATGGVMGIDVCRDALAVARSRGAALPQLSFVLGDAASHPFAQQGADDVVSRFGTLHFPCLESAYAHLRRALVPGGRLAFVCAREAARNLWASIPVRVLVSLAGEVPDGIGRAAGPFILVPWQTSSDPASRPIQHRLRRRRSRNGACHSSVLLLASSIGSNTIQDHNLSARGLADPGLIHSVAAGAGFRDIQLTSLDRAVYLGADVDDALELFFETDGCKLAPLLEAVGYARAADGLREALAPYAGQAGVFMPASAWLVKARA